MDTITLISQAHSGDKEARDKLVLNNTGLIWSIVKRFVNRGYESEDLFQIGCIGLIKAIDKFNLEFNVQFSTYAVPMITGEIKRFLRDDGLIKISRNIKENQGKILSAAESFRRQYGREPTVNEIAEKCDLNIEEVLTAMEASKEVESLHREINYGDSSTMSLIDKIEDKSEENEKIINRLMISQLMGGLQEQERMIIIMRYYKNKTQSEVACELGVSQVQVSRMEKKILLKLRSKI